MIDLRNYLAADLTAEREFSIEVKVMVWLTAGAGKVLGVGPTHFAIEGKIQVIGSERALALQLSLGEPALDEAGVPTGGCTLRVGDEADGEAVYRVEGDSLVLLGQVDGQATRVALRSDGRHSLIDIDGKRKASLRLTAG